MRSGQEWDTGAQLDNGCERTGAGARRKGHFLDTEGGGDGDRARPDLSDPAAANDQDHAIEDQLDGQIEGDARHPTVVDQHVDVRLVLALNPMAGHRDVLRLAVLEGALRSRDERAVPAPAKDDEVTDVEVDELSSDRCDLVANNLAGRGRQQSRPTCD